MVTDRGCSISGCAKSPHQTDRLLVNAVRPMDVSGFVFEYLYRDAGNFKTYGAMVLEGKVGVARDQIRACLDADELFVAEQVGVPSLCAQHWENCGSGPSHLDHAFHEFVDLRPATEEEREILPAAGSLEVLIDRFRRAAGRWDVSLSPNCRS